MRYIFSLLLFLPFNLFAQTREEGFDINFKPTPHTPRYWVITEKKDSLWHRMAYFVPERTMAREAWYRDDSCKIAHGTYTSFHDNKILSAKGNYVDGKKDGLWLTVNPKGFVTDSSNYRMGHRIGVSMAWYDDGMLSDSLNYDGAGNGSEISYHEDGRVASAGYVKQDTLHRGRWRYYHTNGEVKAMETYDDAGNVSDWSCFDEKGNKIDTAACRPRDADFPGGEGGWRRFLEKNLDPRTPINNKAPDGHYQVMVQFIVERDGSLSDIHALTKFGFGMEAEVLRMMKKSPKWVPALLYGVPVKAYRKQPITFVVSSS
ncbi:MORN repeat variant [Cnuella takakiae]|uniref:MORN repeat variant n=1 Tax=Cnuella takakiae TaxID=1302690 RepID=A0A1M5BBL6_9BACT|nr:energy transducer TonB [Cnuella takakiae]OLY93421.1 hypothetical protein BUE76_17170 [Cnuella takakiae]SHF39904.1 MORN repeat variant [Cnuella takakiae]